MQCHIIFKHGHSILHFPIDCIFPHIRCGINRDYDLLIHLDHIKTFLLCLLSGYSNVLPLFKHNVTDVKVLKYIRDPDHPGLSHRLGLLLVPKIIPEYSQDDPTAFGLTH